MSWTFVARATELREFRRCRRAWDLGARVRQGYSPLATRPFDFERAIRDSLATYYFPAMDDWSRSIVRPLATKSFDRSMTESRAAREALSPLTDDEHDAFIEHLGLGQALLANYFVWAAAMDEFDSIFVDHEVWAPIPNPADTARDLGTADERPIRYLGRIDQLVGDPEDEFWVVRNCIVADGWMDDAALIDDDLGRGHCWALQLAYPQLVIAGTIVNELRLRGQLEAETPDEIVERDQRDMTGARRLNQLRSPTAPPMAWVEANMHEVDHIAQRDEDGLFRRTVIRRSPRSYARVGAQIAGDVALMQRPDLEVGPTFTPRCAVCAFKGPCDAMESGNDPGPRLSAGYARLPDDDSEDEGLRQRGPATGLGGRGSKTVNFRWG